MHINYLNVLIIYLIKCLFSGTNFAFLLISTQIRRAVRITMQAAPMVAYRVRLVPSAPALWVINSAMTPKPAWI